MRYGTGGSTAVYKLSILLTRSDYKYGRKNGPITNEIFKKLYNYDHPLTEIIIKVTKLYEHWLQKNEKVMNRFTQVTDRWHHYYEASKSNAVINVIAIRFGERN